MASIMVKEGFIYLSMVVMIALMLTTARERLSSSRTTKMGMSEK
jgi:hypothetical protein